MTNLHCDENSWQVTQDEHGDGADEDDGHVGLARLSCGRYRGRPAKIGQEVRMSQDYLSFLV